ncbi:MAG: ATP-binding protein, partial [Methylococcus sp.]
MSPRILNGSPYHSLAAWLGLLLTLSAMGPGGAMAESTEAIQVHNRAVLFSLNGERLVTLPHRLAADDFPPSGGRVRYRIEVDLNTRPREPLGVYVRKLSLSGQLILNGETIGACGLGDLKNLRCLHQPQLFVPPVSLWRAGVNVLEFDIYANDRQMNGLSPVQVGSAQALGEGPYRRQWLWQVESLRALTWVVVTLGGLALVVSRMLRAEPLYWWFGLCALFNALGNLNILVTDPPLSFEWFSWFVFSSRMVTVPLLLLMLLAVFDRAGGMMARGLVIYTLLMPVGTWISGNNRWAVAAMYLPGLVTSFLLLAGMVRWTWRSRERLHLLVTSLTVVLVLISILDLLRLSGHSDFEGIYWATYVLTSFFLVFGLALMSRLVAALMAERRLSDWLSLASRAAKAGFWDWNLATDRVRWSREMMELFGVAAEAAANDRDTWSLWRARVHPEDLPLAERHAAAAARDRTPLALNYRIQLPTGETRWIETRADISPAAAGQPATLSGISLDVTERRQVEEDLHESEARFRTLFERLPVAYQSLDIQGHWLYANDKMAELLGFDRPGSMLGLCFSDYWDEDRGDEFPATFGRLKANGQIGGDLHLRRRDGAAVIAHITGYVQRDLQGRFLRTHCVLIDVTERRALEAEILAMNASLERRVQERTAQLQAATEAKSQFLATMSHEIRTPMNAVLGLAQLLEREPLAAEHREMIQRIRAAGRSLLGIINDILDFSKIEAGQLVLDRQVFALAGVLKHLENLLGASAQAKGLTLMTAAPPLPGRLVGDSLRLEQILINLTGNAIKFTSEGEVSIRVLPLELTATTARLRFEVRDTGIGLNPEARDKLFQPFTQADSGISRRFGGTGLGLSISKRLVELMGGLIGVESEPGQGSTFWFELPFMRETPAAPVDAPTPSGTDAPAAAPIVPAPPAPAATKVN